MDFAPLWHSKNRRSAKQKNGLVNEKNDKERSGRGKIEGTGKRNGDEKIQSENCDEDHDERQQKQKMLVMEKRWQRVDGEENGKHG
jgi:hypothetical protein